MKIIAQNDFVIFRAEKPQKGIITIKTEPIAKGAKPTGAQPPIAAAATVKTRKKVPINSVTYLGISFTPEKLALLKR